MASDNREGSPLHIFAEGLRLSKEQAYILTLLDSPFPHRSRVRQTLFKATRRNLSSINEDPSLYHFHKPFAEDAEGGFVLGLPFLRES